MVTLLVILAPLEGRADQDESSSEWYNGDKPFYNSPAISYNTPTVLLPAALPLLAASLAGLGFAGVRRRKKVAQPA